MELTPTSETSGEKKKKRTDPRESIKKVADKAIERQAERPRIFYGLEDSKEKPPVPPPVEILKSSKVEKDDDEEEVDAAEENREEDLEVEAVSEAEAPTEEISPEAERPVVLQELSHFEGEALPEKSSEPKTPAEAADEAARLFFAEVESTGDIEAGAQAAREALGAAQQDEAETVVAESPNELSAAESGPREFGEDEAEINLHAETPEAAPEESEDDDAAAGAAPPRSPYGPGAPPGYTPGGPARPDGPGGYSYNAAPVAAAAEKPTHVPEYDPGNPAAAALIGGIIGYLVGRRRGRIKTEKRLLPIQKKLEGQVTDLHWQLKEKEGEIRKIAARKAEIEGVEFMNRLDKAVEKSIARAEKHDFRKPEQSSGPRRQRAPEARNLHGPRKHERIGHMLMAAEADASKQAESRPYREELRKIETARPINDQRVETMNRQDLLLLSEKVVVDGTTLRQIYESKLIGERGLRRLLAEHLRGGDVKKVLRQEIIEREIDFERDPLLRDQPTYGGAAAGTGGPKADKTQLNEMLAKAGANLPADSEEAAFYKARAAYEVAEREQQSRQKQIMDAAFIAVILVLLGLVVLLAMTRG